MSDLLEGRRYAIKLLLRNKPGQYAFLKENLKLHNPVPNVVSRIYDIFSYPPSLPLSFSHKKNAAQESTHTPSPRAESLQPE